MAGIAMLALVLSPLGIPASVVIILLGVIDPLVDPVVTMLDVHANCAAAVLIVGDADDVHADGRESAGVSPSAGAAG
jgi:proton glutamate symport protein